MTRTYEVKVTAGPYSWTVTDDDPPGYGLADPLTIGWSLPDTDHRPNQPDPMVASFGVVAASSADMPIFSWRYSPWFAHRSAAWAGAVTPRMAKPATIATPTAPVKCLGVKRVL